MGSSAGTVRRRRAAVLMAALVPALMGWTAAPAAAHGSPAHFAEIIRQDRALWAPIIAKENIHLDAN